MGKSTISMAIFHCYVSSPEGILKEVFFCLEPANFKSAREGTIFKDQSHASYVFCSADVTMVHLMQACRPRTKSQWSLYVFFGKVLYFLGWKNSGDMIFSPPKAAQKRPLDPKTTHGRRRLTFGLSTEVCLLLHDCEPLCCTKIDEIGIKLRKDEYLLWKGNGNC